MVTSDKFTDAIIDMGERCEVLRTSISEMRNIEGINVEASSLLTDAYIHICDAIWYAQKALITQILSEAHAERTAPVGYFQKFEND